MDKHVATFIMASAILLISLFLMWSGYQKNKDRDLSIPEITKSLQEVVPIPMTIEYTFRCNDGSQFLIVTDAEVHPEIQVRGNYDKFHDAGMIICTILKGSE